MNAIRNLKPEIVWRYFDEILKIPRPSKKEGKIIDYLLNFAKEHSLEWRKDKTGNFLISRPASKGFEDREIVVLQSHMDMVCEKDKDVRFDFRKDPIQAYVDGEWVTARGTTLGADNGIGIAAQLAILSDNEIEHGPLECLFTVDEESGMTGAFGLEPGFFKGHILLNLDSEDDGELFIGCAGGNDTIITCPLEWEKSPEDWIPCKLTIGGLLGGHSGDDIHKGRGNANKILARLLWNLSRQFSMRVCCLEGGNLRNAIPRDAAALILVSPDRASSLEQYVKEFDRIVKKELHPVEKELTITLKEEASPSQIISDRIIMPIITALHACPNGVIEMSRTLPDMVETSTNLASIRTTDENTLRIVTSQRSSLETAKTDIASRIRSLFELIGADVKHEGNYPGWSPDPDSPVLRITEAQHEQLFGKKPVVRAIHAGLECGLFLRKYPGMDMISFGPTIKEAHSPREKMKIDTVPKFWNLLLAVLKQIPARK